MTTVSLFFSSVSEEQFVAFVSIPSFLVTKESS